MTAAFHSACNFGNEISSNQKKETITMTWRISSLLLAGALWFFPLAPQALAGGDGPEAMSMGNMCMVMFGYDMIHITAYQPGKSRNEYCQEIPATGKTILTFDIENPKFRDLPIEVRIIRDPLVPLKQDTDLGPLTEKLVPARLYRTGTFNFEHDFKANGNFIGLVTLTRENGEKETAQFKFMIGETFWTYVPPILGTVLIGLMILAYWRHSHPKSKALAPSNA